MTAYSAFASFLEHLEDQGVRETGIVPWACPVPYFGRLAGATLATVGLNPSIREFTDATGAELQGLTRRFPTLSSMRLRSWTDADATHVGVIANACSEYFTRNPYERWFGVLDRVLKHSRYSYYGDLRAACHLDLVPFATHTRWGALAHHQRQRLLRLTSRHLGSILNQTSIRVLILNGQSVISQLSSISNAVFTVTKVDRWQLGGGPRSIPGLAYLGTASQIGGVNLEAPIAMIGFNHNLQSSFGVTNGVTRAIGIWISSVVATSMD